MIWIISFPRSGNTYLRNILKSVYGIESGEYHNDPDLLVDDLSQFKVAKSHLLPDQIEPLKPEDKVVLLVRDGRDCMVSIAHQKKDVIAPDSDLFGNMEEAIYADRNSFFGGWSRNIETWIDRADILIRYEELVADPQATMDRLESIIGLKDADWDALPSFQQLKKGGAAVSYGKGELRKSHALETEEKYTESFFRKGKSGSWKEELPEELHLLFWNIHGDTMRRLGYQPDGTIRVSNTNFDLGLKSKLGLEVRKPNPKHILIEANKLLDKGNDGIKRYQLELLTQFSRLSKSNSHIHISLLLRDQIHDLDACAQEILPTYHPDEHGPDPERAHEAITALHAGNHDPLHKRISRKKKSIASRWIPNFLEGTMVLALIKKMVHIGIIGMLRCKDLLVKVVDVSLHLFSGVLNNTILFKRFLTYNSIHRIKQPIKAKKSYLKIKKQLAGFDLVHVPLPQHAPPFKWGDTPLIATIHDFTHVTHPQYHTAENNFNADFGMRALAQRSPAHYISVSKSTSADMQRYLKGESRIHETSEAANGRLFRLYRNADDLTRVKKKYNVHAERYIVTLSTIEPRKNIITAVKAFNQYLKNTQDPITKMVIIGKVGWGKSAYAELEWQINKNPDRYIVTGFVEEGDLPILLNGARAMLYLSFYEGFGLPILEAYKSGLPVIAGNNSSQIEVAGPQGLLVDPLDEVRVSNYLNELINNDQFYQQQRAICLKHAENFSWYYTAEKTIEAYLSILDES